MITKEMLVNVPLLSYEQIEEKYSTNEKDFQEWIDAWNNKETKDYTMVIEVYLTEMLPDFGEDILNLVLEAAKEKGIEVQDENEEDFEYDFDFVTLITDTHEKNRWTFSVLELIYATVE